MSLPMTHKSQLLTIWGARIYHYLVNVSEARLDYNGSGNSFSISPIRWNGGLKIGRIDRRLARSLLRRAGDQPVRPLARDRMIRIWTLTLHWASRSHQYGPRESRRLQWGTSPCSISPALRMERRLPAVSHYNED